MRTYRSTRGPFPERPFFSQEEIEVLCYEELTKVGLMPAQPEAIRIERFIEKRFKISPMYEELPPGVLGFTRFNPKTGVEAIIIARSLAEEETRTAERRINSTLAHEAGHGLLHAHLFVDSAQAKQLFGDEYDPKTPKILCRDELAGTGRKTSYDGRWWEFQANQTIGALLMPKKLLESALAGDVLKSAGTFGLPQIKPNDRAKAVGILSKVFNVNPAAAKIRLDQLFPVRDDAQMTL